MAEPWLWDAIEVGISIFGEREGAPAVSRFRRDDAISGFEECGGADLLPVAQADTHERIIAKA